MSDPIVIIEEIISSAMDTANSYTDKADTAAQALITQSMGWWNPDPNSDTGFVISAVEPDIPEVTDSVTTYEAQLDKMVALLSDQLAGFFLTYYPLAADSFDEATSWLLNTITNGGTGINPLVEEQIWQRARDRVIADGRRVESQIITGYAAKGYMMPAGSMLKKIDEARFAQLQTNGEASTTIAAKQAELEIETIKFAIGKAIESRQMAMAAAADYIRSIASTPDSALKTANMRDENKAKMMSAAAAWYGARLDRDKIILSSQVAEMGNELDVFKTKLAAKGQLDQHRVAAIASAADVYGRTASAALSGLNSIVSTASNI